MRPTIVALVASLAGIGYAGGRLAAAVPRFTLKEEWRVASTENLRDVGFIKIAPDGRVIVAPFNSGDAEIVAFDSGGTKSQWRLPVGWGNAKDVRRIDRMGFVGSTMWISDRGYGQVALVNANGKVTKSLEQPSFVRPVLSERRKFPVFGSLDAYAVYADGSWLVRPYREHEFVDTPEYDSTSVHLLRIAESGVIQRVIAKIPEDPIIEINEPGRNIRMGMYFANRALFDVSQDGMRIAVVYASLAGKDSGTYRVTSLNERGDTLFSKRFPFTAELISAAARDSALRRNNIPAIKAEQEKRMPRIYTPVTEVMIGRDRTTWLKLHPTAADSLTTTHLVLDVHGELVATVTMPNSINVLMADRDHAWGVERQKGNLRSVVRYKLVPAR